MARTSNYIVIQDGGTSICHIPFPNGLPKDVWFPEFDALDADLAQRPVLTFRIGHTGDEARLRITLNSLEVVNANFTTTSTRAWIEVIDHDILRAANNELMAEATEGTGELTISDLVLTYKNVRS